MRSLILLLLLVFSTPVDAKVLFVMAGGNASCRPDPVFVYSPFLLSSVLRLSVLMHEVGEHSWVVSCFTHNANLRYFISSDRYTPRSGISNYYRDVEREANSADQVIMIGHSYGGWLVMNTMLNSQIEAVNLFTVDAISAKLCTVTSLQYCTTAPQDFGYSARQEISEKTSSWNNFYQTLNPILHSSEIPEAVNQHLLVPHLAIDTDSRVWNAIRSKIKQ